jgi:hypothetical protein
MGFVPFYGRCLVWSCLSWQTRNTKARIGEGGLVHGGQWGTTRDGNRRKRLMSSMRDLSWLWLGHDGMLRLAEMGATAAERSTTQGVDLDALWECLSWPGLRQ